MLLLKQALPLKHMPRHHVSLAHCCGYEEPLLTDALQRVLAPLGGIGSFVRPGMQVLIKPNLLAGKPPEAAVTTHPAFVAAVVRLVREAGCNVMVGDSPGLGSFESVTARSGIARAVAEAGGCLVPFQETIRVPATGRFRELELAKTYLEADLVINLPKLKTHEMMGMTAAVKNLYGTVVGAQKVAHHLTAGHDRSLFAGLLLEIAMARPVALTIVDAVVAMEGNGPNSGTPRQVGLLLAGSDPLAVDVVAADLIGLPEGLRYLEKEAQNRGLTGVDRARLVRVGEAADVTLTRPFTLPEAQDLQFGLPRFLRPLARRYLSPLPEADPERCVRCGVCRDACPPHAITITNNALSVASRRCIRCWCCRELCPYHALRIKRGSLAGIMSWLTERY